jgi:hypothetical protein
MDMTPGQTQAIDALKRTVSTRPLVALGRDYQMQSLLAVWEYVEIKKAAFDPITPAGATLPVVGNRSVVNLIGNAWNGLRADPDSIRRLLGPTFPGFEVARRAISLGLVYPDGTIHRAAETWLAAEAVRMTKQMMLRAKNED